MKPRFSALVPTLGLSPWLVPCLEALRRDGGADLELLVVHQGHELGGGEVGEAVFRLADTVLRLPANLGFAAANNLGLAKLRGELLATVNDDVVIEPGWLEALASCLDANPRSAGAQGLNLQLRDPGRIDGWGIGWNRWWQAVQLGHGISARQAPDSSTEIFGVSATAALFRRRALEEIGGAKLEVFDENLFAYYEDVLLAGRLRQAGWNAMVEPAARACHAGSTSGRLLPWGSRQWIHGNRLLVLADLLGSAFWPRLPWLLLRDALDILQALARGEGKSAAGIFAGVWRAAVLIRASLRHRGEALPLEQLYRFRVAAGGGDR